MRTRLDRATLFCALWCALAATPAWGQYTVYANPQPTAAPQAYGAPGHPAATHAVPSYREPLYGEAPHGQARYGESLHTPAPQRVAAYPADPFVAHPAPAAPIAYTAPPLPEPQRAPLAVAMHQPRPAAMHGVGYTNPDSLAPASTEDWCSCAPPAQCCNAWIDPLPCGWFAGFEAVIARPFFTVNAASFFAQPQQVDWNYDFSPRAYFGFVGGSGLGMRARYWQFDQSSDTLNQISADTLSGSTINSDLRLQTIDLELTQKVGLGAWVGNFGGGIRYTSFDYGLNGNVFDRGTGIVVNTASYDLQFNGLGPQFFAELQRPLMGGLSVYGNIRGALLFGNQVRTTDGLNPVQESQDNLLPVGELQLGGQWTHAMRASRLFVRGGVEAQWWGDVGNFGFGSSLFNTAPVVAGDMGLFGINASVGWMR